MSYLVRRAVGKDIPSLMELLKQVNKVHYDGRPDLFKLETKYSSDELSKIIADNDTPVFVCENEDGKILGHGFCVMQRPENTRLLTDILTLYIDDICVDEGARGRHIGKALYEHIVCYGREQGFYNITLNVWTCNPSALSFYEAMGLVPQKICMEKIL